jgi:hypothetical protein
METWRKAKVEDLSVIGRTELKGILERSGFSHDSFNT